MTRHESQIGVLPMKGKQQMPTRRQIRTLSRKEGITLNEAGKKMVKEVIDKANRSGVVPIIIGDDKLRAEQCAHAIGQAIKRLEAEFDCVFMPCIQSTPDGNLGSFLVKAKPRRGSNHG